MRNKGQFTLIIGIFIIVLAIVLALSLYMAYKYYSERIKSEIMKISIGNNRIIIKNVYVSNGETELYTTGKLTNIETIVAKCINTTSTGIIVKKIVKALIYPYKNLIEIPCISNNTLEIDIMYRNGLVRKYYIELLPSKLRIYSVINSQNITRSINFVQDVRIYYPITGQIVISIPLNITHLLQLYNVDYVALKIVPIYSYLTNNITYLYYLTYGTYPLKRIELNYYYYINNTILQRELGYNYCNIENSTLSIVYPVYRKYIYTRLINCNVFRTIKLYLNQSYSYISYRENRNISIQLTKILELNTPYAIIYGSSLVCYFVSGNTIRCYSPYYTYSAYFEYLFDDPGIENLGLSQVISYSNGTAQVSLDVIPVSTPANVSITFGVVYDLYMVLTFLWYTYVYHIQTIYEPIVTLEIEVSPTFTYTRIYLNRPVDISSILALYRLYRRLSSVYFNIGTYYRMTTYNAYMSIDVTETVRSVDIVPLS